MIRKTTDVSQNTLYITSYAGTPFGFRTTFTSAAKSQANTWCSKLTALWLSASGICVCVLIVDVASTRFCNGQKWYYPWNNQGLVDSSFRISLWKPGALEIRGSQHVELQGHINWSIILFDHFSCFIYGNCHFQGLKPPLLSSFLITTWSQCHENHHFLYGEGVWGIPQNYDLMEKCGWIAR